ncbi:MAG: glycosyltransferase family A protein [Acidimicrobiales bacterium]
MTASTLVLLAGGWLAGLVLLWRVRTPGAAGDGALAAAVSVVVPARDEAHNLPRLLGSLRAQNVPPLEVIVVDDGSTDATAAVAADLGAVVVATEDLPAGWAGKPWACATGVAAARGEVLLLLDADTWLSPDGVAHLAAAHDRLAPNGLLSVQPFHVTERPYEQLSAFPNVVSVLASGTAALRPARSPGVAFGPCLVTSSEALAAAGGFAAVAGESIEDIALARAFERTDRPVRCLGGGDVVRFRMYPDGLRSLVEGWSKNLSGGARRARPLPLIGAVLWVCAAVSAAIELVLWSTPWAAVAYAAVAGQLAWMLRRLGSFRWWTSVLFPVALTAFVVLFVRSLVLRVVRRQVTWRGRSIDLRKA